MHLWLSHCHRGQAPSHSLNCIHQVDISLLLPCFALLLIWLLILILGAPQITVGLRAHRA
ncbi:hypothetical protein QCBJ_23730 [Pseudomonas sp. QC2]|nr:hypothetical protein QCBJ_23730 [Pseudomonas sp. QC2]